MKDTRRFLSPLTRWMTLGVSCAFAFSGLAVISPHSATTMGAVSGRQTGDRNRLFVDRKASDPIQRLMDRLVSPAKDTAFAFLVLPVPQGGSAQNVVWTNAVGVSVSGNSLTKTAGDSWANAGAASTQAIASGDGYVEFTASETTTYRMCGLSHGDDDQAYPDIDFAIYPTATAKR